MSYETLLTEVEDGIGVITVNRPEVRNTVNQRVIDDLHDALEDFRSEDSVGDVVFTGAGDKVFVAGADIGELGQRTTLDGLPAKMQRLCDEI